MRENTPLIIVDLQRCFGVDEELIEATEKEIKGRNIIIQTKLRHGNALFERLIGASPKPENMELCIPNVGKIVEKAGYGVGPENLKDLKESLSLATEVDICGVELDGSVLAICYQIWDMGILPKPIFELCGGSENRLESQGIAKHIFGA